MINIGDYEDTDYSSRQVWRKNNEKAVVLISDDEAPSKTTEKSQKKTPRKRRRILNLDMEENIPKRNKIQLSETDVTDLYPPSDSDHTISADES